MSEAKKYFTLEDGDEFTWNEDALWKYGGVDIASITDKGWVSFFQYTAGGTINQLAKLDPGYVLIGDGANGATTFDLTTALSGKLSTSGTAADVNPAGTAIAGALSGKQTADATLTAVAGAATGADTYIYFTAADVAAVGTITAAGRALIDDADAATMLTTLGALGYDSLLNHASDNEVSCTIAYTVNKAGGNDTGLLISMTDSASSGVSLPLDIQVGGNSQLAVDSAGNTTAYGAFRSSLAAWGFLGTNGTNWTSVLGGTNAAGGLVFSQSAPIWWTNGGSPASVPDAGIVRNAANVIELTNGYATGRAALLAGNITIGSGTAATDYTLTFDGETNDGVLTWMEDEDYLKLSDDILLDSTERVYFRDTAIHIYSANDGYLDVTADTGLRLNAPVTAGSVTMTALNMVAYNDEPMFYEDEAVFY